MTDVVDDVALAVREHEACPDCSRPGRVVWHYEDSRCPFRGRSRPVPCRGATLAESRDGLHQTWELDAICPACKRKRDAVVAQLKGEQK